MLNRRSSFKNQTCPVLKKPDAALPKTIAAAAIPSQLPHTQSTKFAHRTNSIGHQDYGSHEPLLPRTQTTKFAQRTNSIGHQGYGHDQQPVTRTQPTKVTQRTNSVGHHDYGEHHGHDQQAVTLTQPTKVTQRTNSVGHHDYGEHHGHDQQAVTLTQPTKVTQRTNSVGHHDYGEHHGHDQQAVTLTQPTKVTQRTNSVGHHDYGEHHGHDQQPVSRTQPTNLAQRTNSFRHHDYGHDLLQPVPRTQPAKVTQRTNSVGGHDLLQPVPRTQPMKVTQRTNSVGRPEHEHGLEPALPKKSALPVIEFPVSPEVDAIVVGEGVTNANHPQHKMVHVNLPNPFTCMGCKEFGAGTRFTCQQCNFELHDFCALAPPVLKAHPLHSQHQLLFNPKPGKAGLLRSKCDVCGKPAKGYLFHCSACSFQLHPSCAMLSAKMNFPTHPHPLVILPASTSTLLSGDPGELPCAECKRKRSGQVYRCTVCDYYLHAACAKNMVNGLHANGIKGLEKPSVLGVAAKIATHVVVGFMGGLIEGLGEGLGEALTQNFVKGRCNSAKKSLYPGARID